MFEYDASQAAKRPKVPAAAFQRARRTGLIPDLDASSYQWSRAAVEALDADAIRAAILPADRRRCGGGPDRRRARHPERDR
ncbi:hypothetical protein ACIQVC_35315 [Streptomyces sp. NPDC101112]|jgi:hypothetical protein|uniref:hypothetical protein n=1 Tax=Streptomyces sp. NPDC101112 TaxID=3366105 RepID=UPI003801E649